ncbi:hypothetical protein HanXRQr2_Chr17g0805341 [Helianthus annuus]|uniref:Uncharacterized protein n=1 Tax=Helianthus annuus TaxID=4232 RepID=A0A9K3GUG4_HELAN|nr:hypothetical protein HanXRQr2_Chr17g0805341 [Helianthus annuus]KAJ0813418.1 hypothetical protein HanPSC8_Chr17g0773201 [Helianthus annuus]
MIFSWLKFLLNVVLMSFYSISTQLCFLVQSALGTFWLKKITLLIVSRIIQF